MKKRKFLSTLLVLVMVTALVTACDKADEVPEVPTVEAETTPVETADCPGENRNGRYSDIPESVLPRSEAAYCYFFDNPILVTTWDDVTGTIYADYERTQIIKEADSDDVIYVIGVGDRDCTGTAVAIYNNQYVIINEALFDFQW